MSPDLVGVVVSGAALLVVVFVLFNWWKNRTPKPLTALVCGATGVGKSTLINAILGREVASVGIGRPVTQNTTLISAPDAGMAFYDSKGLEVEDASQTYLLLLSDLFRLRFDRRPRRQIDIVLMCIAEPSARYDPAHEEIANLCEDLRVPLGIALTKSEGNEEFLEVVKAAFPSASFIHPVRALPLETTHFTLPAEGVTELQAHLQSTGLSDVADGWRRSRHASKAHRMAEAARSMVAVNTDIAWANLAATAYLLLLSKTSATWLSLLGDARKKIKRQLVPGFFRRNLLTRFDDSKIDGEVSRRVFPRILRLFSAPSGTRLEQQSEDIVSEALGQLQNTRPFRSRF